MTLSRFTHCFPVEIVLHQKIIIMSIYIRNNMDVLIRGIQDDVSWYIFFANDIIFIDLTNYLIDEKLEQWIVTLEMLSLRVIKRFF